jgi:arylsulfatase A-like enzyme
MLWLHTYQPHGPYLPSSPFRSAYLKDRDFATFQAQRPFLYKFYHRELQPVIDKLRGRYNEQILEVDFKFGVFLNSLRDQGLLENSLVVLTADHGEMFERGYQGHNGPCLYQPMLHIPLIISLPGHPGGKRLAVKAGQVDIMPTILDLLKAGIPPWVEGRSLRPAIEGTHMECRPIFSISEDFSMRNRGLKNGTIAVIQDNHKLIYNCRKKMHELYEILSDPREQRDIAGDAVSRLDTLRDLIRNRFLR